MRHQSTPTCRRESKVTTRMSHFYFLQCDDYTQRMPHTPLKMSYQPSRRSHNMRTNPPIRLSIILSTMLQDLHPGSQQTRAPQLKAHLLALTENKPRQARRKKERRRETSSQLVKMVAMGPTRMRKAETESIATAPLHNNRKPSRKKAGNALTDFCTPISTTSHSSNHVDSMASRAVTSSGRHCLIALLFAGLLSMKTN